MELSSLLVQKDYPPNLQELGRVKKWIDKVRFGLNEVVPFATYKGIIETVPNNIKHKVFKQFNKFGNNLGYYVVEAQDHEKLSLFLNYCSDIVWVTEENETALHILCKQKEYLLGLESFMKCAELLVSSGIDINLRDNHCRAPIDWAVEKGHIELVKLLLDQKGIDIDAIFERVCTTPIMRLTIPSITSRKLIEVHKIPVDTKRIPVHSIVNLIREYFGSEDETGFIKNCETTPTLYCLNFFLEMSVIRNWKKVVRYLYFRNEGDYKKYNVLNLAFEADNFEMFEDAKSYVTYEIRDILSLLVSWNGDLKIKWYKFIMDLFKLDKGMFAKINTLKAIGSMKNSYILEDFLVRGAPLNFTDEFGEHVFCKFGYENWLNSCVVKIRKQEEDDIFHINCANLLPFKDNATPEFEIVNYMANCAEFSNLLTHPVITILTNEKWRRIKSMFYFNFIFSVLLYTNALLYVNFHYLSQMQQKQMPYRSFLLSLNSLSFCKELAQLCVSPKQYVRYFENILDFVVVANIFSIIFSDLATLETKRQLSAFLIVVISFEVLLLLGKFRLFSRNSAMFQAVTIEYVKFLLFFSVLLIGFSFSFHILFGSAKKSSPLFETWYLSIFKVIIMLTGEIEGSNIHFENSSLASCAIFIVFLFSVVIILANLLNGLAISDVEKIKNEADKLTLQSRINYIYNLECIISKKFLGFRSMFNFFKLKSLIFPSHSNETLLVTQECSCPGNIKGYINYFNRRRHDSVCKFAQYSSPYIVPIDKDAILKLQVIVNANEERVDLAKRRTQQFQQESENIELLKSIQSNSHKVMKKLDEIDCELQKCISRQGNLETCMIKLKEDMKPTK